MIEIEKFLKKNGYRQVNAYLFNNNKCTVKIKDETIQVSFDDERITFISVNLYWLIGFLTYHKLMPKNYKN